MRPGSFNTQPPEGGCRRRTGHQRGLALFQHTAARRRLLAAVIYWMTSILFQHTAARRRLLPVVAVEVPGQGFQHTAARRRLPDCSVWIACIHGFNTQPPEGGCVRISIKSVSFVKFQHTAARRRLLTRRTLLMRRSVCFNTQPPEGGCVADAATGQFERLFQHTAARRRLRLTGRRLSVPEWFQHTAARRRLRTTA